MKISPAGNRIPARILRILKAFLLAFGIVAVTMTVLAFTSAPFRTWYGMALKKAGIHRPPDYIVCLGGGGMPSESGLIRIWYAAKAAEFFPKARVIVALPGDSRDSSSSVRQMKNELILRGVAPDRIILEDSGTNTRAQALFIRGLVLSEEGRKMADDRYRMRDGKTISDIRYPISAIVIVTSPEHLLRAVLAFRKAGFLRVDGLPAFEAAIESDIRFNAARLGGKKFIPDVGESITLRYQFWTQMEYEFLILREWTAMGYYKLMGWI